jgi:hypothetical protein
MVASHFVIFYGIGLIYQTWHWQKNDNQPSE